MAANKTRKQEARKKEYWILVNGKWKQIKTET